MGLYQHYHFRASDRIRCQLGIPVHRTGSRRNHWSVHHMLLYYENTRFRYVTVYFRTSTDTWHPAAGKKLRHQNPLHHLRSTCLYEICPLYRFFRTSVRTSPPCNALSGICHWWTAGRRLRRYRSESQLRNRWNGFDSAVDSAFFPVSEASFHSVRT